jgi:hypothetical protein
MCFVWISEQTAIISLYIIKRLVFITETECVYSAVRAESYKTDYLSSLKGFPPQVGRMCAPSAVAFRVTSPGCKPGL